MKWKQKTIATYNKSAKELSEYFRGIGSRTSDIKLAFKLSRAHGTPSVLEIGCGDGRDAKEIVKLTDNYTGFDISKELIKLARLHVPTARFEIADATSFDYGHEKYDIVFAFASLLHLDKSELTDVLGKVHKSLKPNGVILISLKHADTYKEELKKDKFGERMFYFYNPELIKKLASNYLVLFEKSGFTTTGNTKWFEMILKRVE